MRDWDNKKITHYKKISLALKKVNKYDLSGKYGKCFIKDTYFLFDKEDYELIKNYRWYIDGKNYVKTNMNIDGKKTSMRLHRLIINVNDKNKQIDHINHNPLDNRKENLRICSNMQNNWNKGKQKNNTSGIKGVCFLKNCNKWYARITVNGKTYNLGLFKNLLDAKKEREIAEKKYFGKFSNILGG